MKAATLGWVGIVRLGLVQTALGAIVVLTTSTLNRVMVVELALPATLPGALVGFHYAVQMLRPRFGHGSDSGRRRTPWIVGGMALLALGGCGAALATAWMGSNVFGGILLAFAAFTLIGVGVGAAGTSLLALLASGVEPGKRAAAAMVVWVMMIAGFVLTATLAGHFLDPFSMTRLVTVTATTCAAALMLTLLAVVGVERRGAAPSIGRARRGTTDFRAALADVWRDTRARRFTIFVFVSMLAYSTQDLILEPFAGAVYGLSPGESTRLAGVQHGGVLLGMILVGIIGTTLFGRTPKALRVWTIAGCLGSAVALVAIALGGAWAAPAWALRPSVFVLGTANGAFAVAAIASMMALAGAGREGGEPREGIRMGLWGAAQAVAFGLGGFLGTVAIDATRQMLGSAAEAYAVVFMAEAMTFVAAGWLASRVGTDAKPAGLGTFASQNLAGATGA